MSYSNPNSSPNQRSFDVRGRTRRVVDHHYDEQKPGKPLYLLIPGGLVALASLALIVYIAYLTWMQNEMAQATGLTLILVLAPFYIAGVFCFSYGYELYDLPKALKLTAFIVFITVASVVILAVLFLVLAGMTNRDSNSRRSSRSSPATTVSGPGWGGFGLPWPIFLGGLGGPRQTVTREVIREVPAEPAAPAEPQPIKCPYCGTTYIPEQTNFTCPNCGAAAPIETEPDEKS